MVNRPVRSVLWLLAPAMFGRLRVSGGEAAEVPLRDSHVTVLREAARTGWTLVLVVKSRGCGWCRELERTMLPQRVEADDRG